MRRNHVLFVIFGPAPESPTRSHETLAALCAEPASKISRVELIYFPGAHLPAGQLAEKLRQAASRPDVRTTLLPVEDAGDSSELLGALSDHLRIYPFLPDEERYLVLLPEGSPILQAVLLRLMTSRHLPAAPVSLHERSAGPDQQVIEIRVLELALEDDPRITSRRIREQEEAVSFLLGGVPSKSVVFARLIKRVERASLGAGQTILLWGEAGSGRSRLARRVFELRRVRYHLRGSFVASNGYSLRGPAGMATLVGHGAEGAPPGLLAGADRGVLFIADIDKAGPDHQAVLLRALEDRFFLPIASGKDSTSNFQLITTAESDLDELVHRGKFSPGLAAKLKTWRLRVPPLRERLEDLEQSLDFLLLRISRRTSRQISITGEARQALLDFSHSAQAPWSNNFRDLEATATRLSSLPYDEIQLNDVLEEIETLRESWKLDPAGGKEDALLELLGPEPVAALDRFDRVQLADVLSVCRQSRSLSEAGRVLFGASRTRRKVTNDADRLRKYLAKFDLNWRDLLKE